MDGGDVAQQSECPQYQWTVHLKMNNIVNPMYVYHNFLKIKSNSFTPKKIQIRKENKNHPQSFV